MLKSKRLIFLLFLMFVVISALFLRLQYISTVPTAPIYGNSILINEISQKGDGIYYPIATYNYKSPDAPTEIIEFYSQSGICEQNDAVEGRFVCNGKATPFGEYHVYIDSAKFLLEQQTFYSLEIQW